MVLLIGTVHDQDAVGVALTEAKGAVFDGDVAGNGGFDFVAGEPCERSHPPSRCPGSPPVSCQKDRYSRRGTADPRIFNASVIVTQKASWYTRKRYETCSQREVNKQP